MTVREQWVALRAKGVPALRAWREVRAAEAYEAGGATRWEYGVAEEATRRHGKYTLKVSVRRDVYGELSEYFGSFLFSKRPNAFYIGRDRRKADSLAADWYAPAHNWRETWQWHRDNGVARGDAWLLAQQELRDTVRAHRDVTAVTVTVTASLRGVELASVTDEHYTEPDAEWDCHLRRVDEDPLIIATVTDVADAKLMELVTFAAGWDGLEAAACAGP